MRRADIRPNPAPSAAPMLSSKNMVDPGIGAANAVGPAEPKAGVGECVGKAGQILAENEAVAGRIEIAGEQNIGTQIPRPLCDADHLAETVAAVVLDLLLPIRRAAHGGTNWPVSYTHLR